MAELYDNKDAITGKPLRKGWNLHHMDMSVENYQDLCEDKYIPLNRASHGLIHTAFRYSYAIDKLVYYVQKMEEINNKRRRNKEYDNYITNLGLFDGWLHYSNRLIYIIR